MPEHVDILNAEAHEPKHITDATTGDTGKVITPSSTTNNESELRLLKETEIQNVIDYVDVQMANMGTAGSVWVVAPQAGTIVSVASVIHAAFTGADETITVKIGGVAVTNGILTVTQSGSAAGDVDTATPTALNTVGANQAIEIASNGDSTGATVVDFTIGIQRSSP